MKELNNQNDDNLENLIENNKQKPISVYVRLNEEGFITNISSDIFINDFDGWQKLDEGFGDRFAHAQTCYFGKPLIDENGNYVYSISSLK